MGLENLWQLGEWVGIGSESALRCYPGFCSRLLARLAGWSLARRLQARRRTSNKSPSPWPQGELCRDDLTRLSSLLPALSCSSCSEELFHSFRKSQLIRKVPAEMLREVCKGENARSTRRSPPADTPVWSAATPVPSARRSLAPGDL